MEREIVECKRRNVLVLALVGVLGATETGGIDDLEGLAALAEKHGIWFHVDAAWGGPCIKLKEERSPAIFPGHPIA
eukprot:g13140.t1